MREVVEMNFQEFMDHYQIPVIYKLDKNGREGYCWIDGMIYKIIFRDQPREKDLQELVSKIIDEKIFLVANKLYRPSQNFLEKEGISYLETDGNLFFVDWQGAEEKKKRIKQNFYDQQLNESRLKCKNGSAIREGFLIQPELVEKPVKELAEIFDVGKSTVYYYLNQMKKAGYLEQTEEGIEVKEEVFDEEEIIENLVVRGSHKLIPHWRVERNTTKEPMRLRGSGEILKGCKFYDEIASCEKKNIRERIKREHENGYLVFISPYKSGGLKSLDEEFRKRFVNWFMKRQGQKRVT